MLDTLDEAERESALHECHKSHKSGPFSIFFTLSNPRERISCDNICVEDLVAETPQHCEVSNCSALIATDGEVSLHINLQLPTEDSARVGKFVDNTLSVQPPRSDLPHSLDLELRTHFFSDKATQELMHNYVNVVADLLQPASHYQNPYKSIYVPTALVGSIDGLGGCGAFEATHSNAAVFHAILSVSAFHLRGTNTTAERATFDELGRLHRGKALKSLQIALLDELDKSDHHAAMSAMMSLVSSDVCISSRDKDYLLTQCS